MDYINGGIAALNRGVDDLLIYARENGVAICILIVIFYFVRSSVSKKKAELFHGHVLAQESTSARNATSREEELRQVRLRQQELADERSKEAARLAKEKELQERERKNHVAKKPETGGDRLGRSTTTSTTTTTSSTTKKSTNSSTGSASSGSRSDPPTYNPMQPWASHSTGYRPARRSVNRG